MIPAGWNGMIPTRDFADRAFHVGSLTGVRVFGVNDAGMLTGAVYTDWVWQPGTNLAECFAITGRRDGHELLAKDCRCGMYAYYNGALQTFSSRPVVVGIITGWGRYCCGSRGFRAEKAVIRALVRPPEKELVGEFDAIAAHYPKARIYDSQEDAVQAIPLTDRSGPDENGETG